MAPRKTIKSRPKPQRRKPAAKRVQKATQKPQVTPAPYKPFLSNRANLWKVFALVMASILYLSPLTFHRVAKEIHFEGMVPEKDKFFRDYLTLVEKGDKDQAISLLSPETRAWGEENMGPLIATFLKAGPFQDCHLLNTIWESKVPSWEMIYYLDYEKGSGVADFKIHKEGQGFVVDKFLVKPMDRNFDQACTFYLAEGTAYGLFFLLVGWGLMLWNAHTLVRCCYTPLKHKWAWILFILVGFGSLSMDWARDPIVHFKLLSFHAPVADVSKDRLWEPWRIGLTFPAGMVAFLLRGLGREKG